MKREAATLRQRYGPLEWRPEVEYGDGTFTRTYPAVIESAGGTVLFKATDNADPDDARLIVTILNRVMELARLTGPPDPAQ